MERSGKELIILVDKSGLGAMDRSLLERCDRVAMTPDAMLAFEEEGLSFFTFDDIYGYRQFREDNLRMMDETEGLFRELDKKYSASLKYPRAFTGNISWFLIFFATARYVSKACECIKKDYGRIYLAGSSRYDRPFRIDLDFSERGLAFCDFNRELASKVSMMKDVLAPECFWSENAPVKSYRRPMSRRQLFFSGGRLAKKALASAAVFLKEWLSKKRGVILVIQDRNEVSFVKRRMTGFVFKNPVKSMLENARSGSAEKQDLDPMFAEEVRRFAGKWFPEFETRVLEVFEMYFEKAIRYLGAFRQGVDKIFRDNGPKALFYSLSANRVYEDVYAYVANEKSIPVFYFQHAGSTVFQQEDVYQRYLERNRNVKKINICKSRMERELLGEAHYGEKVALGSSKLYELYLSQKTRRRKDILYCPGIFNAYNYKDLMANVPDRELFEASKDIVEIASEFGVEMDIKVHPNDEEHNYTYFSDLLKAKRAANINVLRGFPAERIMRDYRLFIFDYIGTTLVPDSVVFETPVILYMKDYSILQERTIPDLEGRFHVARSRPDLVKYMNLYVQGKLETKFSTEVIDKYAFPSGEGDPCVKMAGYVKNVIDNVKI